MTKRDIKHAVLGLAAVGAIVVLFTLIFGGYGFIVSACCAVGALAELGDDKA